MFEKSDILFVAGLMMMFVVGIAENIYASKFRRYLKKNNYDRWCEVTGSGSATGGDGGSGFYKYVFGYLDNEDVTIRKYRTRIRCLIIIFALSFLCEAMMIVNILLG